MREISIHRLRALWRRMTLVDRAAAFALIAWAASRAAAAGARVAVPGSGFLALLALAAVIYFLVRVLPWVRSNLLWSLRNRLIVAYVLIAVVPLVLVLSIVGLSSYLLYLQFGAHLLQDDLEQRTGVLSSTAYAVGSAVKSQASAGAPLQEDAILHQSTAASAVSEARDILPGLRVQILRGESPALRFSGGRQFEGLVQEGEVLDLQVARLFETAAGKMTVVVAADVSPELLDSLSPELGVIQITTLRAPTAADNQALVLPIADRRVVPAEQTTSRHRRVAPSAGTFDFEVNGSASLDAVWMDPVTHTFTTMPVLAAYSLRPSQVNHLLFRSLGVLGDPLVLALKAIGIVFLLIEGVALLTGIVLTRSITRTVSELYEATQHIRRGDFTQRVRIERRDQLGVLGESFNAMTSSISGLIEEQAKRQRLENEISIAKEVQEQLFPKSLPDLPGVELAAICRAARTVSGDYYDFIRLGPSRLGLTVADISGKGISAALLMASLQAALRSQAMLDGNLGTGDLVARLNRHLFRNTSEERYATFFYAVYDASSGILTYTNAGHVTPLYVVGDQVRKLEDGGTVVGLFEDCSYDQGSIRVTPGALLVAFSDGLVEPENVYGEEFGMERITQEVLRLRNAPAAQVAEGLLDTVEQWAGTLEQADDMTVLVARLGQVGGVPAAGNS
jgi:sigma-B regulation protein RsbU (phosphoserine phosphatase)